MQIGAEHPAKNLGANYLGDGTCTFTVWAPSIIQVELRLVHPEERILPMEKNNEGYFFIELDNIQPGTQYFYRLNGKDDRPDPASHFQPKGVHGPSAVVDHQAYQWKDTNWKGIPLSDYIIYEMHVGTFTDEGTFEAMHQRLDDLVELGVNAIEILPVSQFPGSRNWGYDGVHPYAVQNTYGTPEQFKKLIDACHQRGLAVVLDVVYNHLGPEGNYLPVYGPYFIDKYHTPWGAALNFDEPYSDHVRDYFANNAVFWLEHYHVDALRLDAIHAVMDMGAKHFWRYVNEKIQDFSARSGRPYYTIAESDLNDTKVIKPFELGGWGFSSQWMDDFHHALHALLTKEDTGYYSDFGKVEHLAKAFQKGYIHDGEYSEYRKRIYGNSSEGISGEHFVVCTQNHDQVGNRMLGDRLTALVSFDALKLGAAAMLLSPYIPMLFMGEEYAEEAPFQYFVSHTDKALVEAVRKGRREEFKAFAWLGEAPDPQSEETFRRSTLNWNLHTEGKHNVMWEWYKELIRLRKTHAALHNPDKKRLRVDVINEQIIALQRWQDKEAFLCLMNFADAPVHFKPEPVAGTWQKVLDSTDERWNGSGKSAPDSLSATTELSLDAYGVALYRRQ
jgi:maltooligosyltrehalose trehalohydrolase